MDINKTLAEEFKLRQEQIDNTVALLDDDKTIPFIARYRKELTGSLDDQVLREIADRLTYLRNLEKRKGEIISSITEQEKMTDEIMSAIENAKTLVEVEDIYRPFKPKRKTRASVAREKGLEPLAELILTQDKKCDPQVEGSKFINEDKGVKSADEALQGAMDIIAEDISDDADLRKYIRTLFSQIGVISSKASDENTESVYENYYDYAEAVGKIAGHRVLALDRGEKEGVLKVSVNVPEGAGERACVSKYVKNKSECGQLVTAACEDGYKRLIYPSIEREIRAELSANAQEGAIKVFSSNLRQLLMQPPVKDTVTLGLDPGYAHGCKTAVVHGGLTRYSWKVASEKRQAEALAADYGTECKYDGKARRWKVKTPQYTEEEFKKWQVTKKKRQEILDQCRKGKVNILFATQLAREGLDIPSLCVGHTVTPKRGDGKNNTGLNLEQEIGRIMRKDPQNPDKKAVWFDYVDASVGVLKGQYYSRRKVYKRLGIKLPSKPKSAEKDVIDGLLDSIKF